MLAAKSAKRLEFWETYKRGQIVLSFQIKCWLGVTPALPFCFCHIDITCCSFLFLAYFLNKREWRHILTLLHLVYKIAFWKKFLTVAKNSWKIESKHYSFSEKIKLNLKWKLIKSKKYIIQSLWPKDWQTWNYIQHERAIFIFDLWENVGLRSND